MPNNSCLSPRVNPGIALVHGDVEFLRAGLSAGLNLNRYLLTWEGEDRWQKGSAKQRGYRRLCKEPVHTQQWE